MKFFAHTRTKRTTAFVVLLVWLFALASGVANACSLETSRPHSMAAEGSAAMTSHAPAELHAHSGAGAGHHDVSDSTKESCLKVCDDGTHTVRNMQSGVDHTDPGPAPLIATLWTASPPVIVVPHQLDDLAPSIVWPPFRVRYSRLAL